MIGEIRQNFTEASASVGLILATALPLPYFCSRGELTQTLAGLALKPLPFGLLGSQELGVLVRV